MTKEIEQSRATKQIRNFRAEEKTKVVLELLKEESTIAQSSGKYELTARTIHNWKKQFSECRVGV